MNRIMLLILSFLIFPHTSIAMNVEDEWVWEDEMSSSPSYRGTKISTDSSLPLYLDSSSYSKDNIATRNEARVFSFVDSISPEEENYILGMKEFRSHNYDSALNYLKNAANSAYSEEKYVAFSAYIIGRIYEFIPNHINYNEAEFWYDFAETHHNARAHEAKERVAKKNNSFLPSWVFTFFDY